MNAKPVRLFTCVWGSYLDLFEKALVQSLCWPLNKAALQGAKWDLCTKREDFGPAVDIAKRVGIDIELHEIPDEMVGDHPMMGAILLKIFRPVIKRNLDSGSRMLLAPPDTIFGGDTIANLLALGDRKDSVIFVAHPRAHPTILDELDPIRSTGNGKLVSYAWKHLHKSWSEAEYYPGIQRINSFVGGVFWRKLNDETMAITHRLPTPYLINWTEFDYNYFNNALVFGQIDHDWPNFLVDQERCRVVGGSDAAFIVEITDAGKNIPPLESFRGEFPDVFWRGGLHNKYFGQFSIVYKKE
jgi:hypothetical protein